METQELHSAHEWLDILYPTMRIGDPDGWRGSDGVTLDTPITRTDFQNRFGKSTVGPRPGQKPIR